MSASGTCMWSEGQLGALMTEASAIVPPAFNEWQGVSELNGVTQIAGLGTLKPFVLSVPSKWKLCFSLPQFTVILHRIFRSVFFCEMCRGECERLGLCPAPELSVLQFKISAASVASFESKESMLFCLILREIQLIFCVCVSHNSYITKQAGDGGFATLSCLQYIHNLCRASWNCR